MGEKISLKSIETINLCYTYHDGTKALNNMNFSVEKGENMAILGPNGAGKSTLLHHFNGLLMPTSGKVVVLDQEVASYQILIGLGKKLAWSFRIPMINCLRVL